MEDSTACIHGSRQRKPIGDKVRSKPSSLPAWRKRRFQAPLVSLDANCNGILRSHKAGATAQHRTSSYAACAADVRAEAGPFTTDIWPSNACHFVDGDKCPGNEID
jgi:hypothetical protein